MKRVINVFFFVSRDYWIGHCVEVNIGSQAKTLPGIAFEMSEIVADHFETCHEHNIDPWRQPSESRVAEMRLKFESAPETHRAQLELDEETGAVFWRGPWSES